MTRQTSGPVAKSPSFLDGKRFVGSAFSEKAFQRLLALAVPALGGFRVSAAAWDMNKLEITLEDPRGGSCAYFVADGGASRKDAAGVAFPRLDALDAGMRAAAPALSGDVPKRVFMADPKFKKERFELAWRIAKSATLSVTDDWGHPFHAMRLLLQEGVSRALGRAVTVDGAYTAKIHHSEPECLLVHPRHESVNAYGYFAVSPELEWKPAYEYLSEPRRAELAAAAPSGKAELGLFTNLSESDVINGSTGKLREGLDALLAKVKEDPSVGLVQFNCCCVPRITGDDVHSVLKRAAGKSAVPFILRGRLATPQGQLRHVVDRLAAARESLPPDGPREGVSFLGFAESPAFRELSEALRRAGAPTRAVLFPYAHPALFPDLLSSRLAVENPTPLFHDAYAAVRPLLGMPVISPDAPYGLARTRAWFGAIFAAMGGVRAAAPEDDPLVAAQARECADLAAAAAREGRRVGIVVAGAAEARRIADPASSLGIPVVRVFEEMGYAVDFFVSAMPGDEPGSGAAGLDPSAMVAEVLLTAAGDPSRHSMSFGATPADLAAWFASGRFFAVFAESAFDRRPAAFGKLPFCLGDFEPGYGGALRTARRFASSCSNDLFRKYGRLF